MVVCGQIIPLSEAEFEFLWLCDLFTLSQATWKGVVSNWAKLKKEKEELRSHKNNQSLQMSLLSLILFFLHSVIHSFIYSFSQLVSFNTLAAIICSCVWSPDQREQHTNENAFMRFPPLINFKYLPTSNSSPYVDVFCSPFLSCCMIWCRSSDWSTARGKRLDQPIASRRVNTTYPWGFYINPCTRGSVW